MVTTAVMAVIHRVIDSIVRVCLSWARLASSLCKVWMFKAQAAFRSHEPVCAAVVWLWISFRNCSSVRWAYVIRPIVTSLERSPRLLAECCERLHKKVGALVTKQLGDVPTVLNSHSG
jgi:hypothetical protein